MKKIKISAVALILTAASFASTSALAADVEAGKAKSSTCVACHGMKGVSMIPMYPNLAGQKEQYLAAQLKAFRDGSRKNMIMAPMAASLSDEDIANLAAYYAKLDPTGK
ncbi:cytochrome c [Paraglaciecola aquimarina]|uniref:Cytochrome c n=1 Tax=Paraglaciecola aquimarina TaxID=1235557 RepID=A0ABU3SSC9_9ALTE|nr:cytochrome c [Paraglaciecola aquimarina]MDU0352890.1 cytochrome c [Paraglaciecola aquimarina]